MYCLIGEEKHLALNADFVATAQILFYVGAINILIVMKRLINSDRKQHKITKILYLNI